MLRSVPRAIFSADPAGEETADSGDSHHADPDAGVRA